MSREVLFERRADCASSQKLLPEHRLDFCGDSRLVQVNPENFVVREDFSQLVPAAFGLVPDDSCKRRAKLVRHRVGRKLERVPVVVHGKKVAAPSGNGKRNRLKLGGIAVFLDIAFYRLAEADSDFLRRVARNALRGVRNERVRKARVYDLVDELLRRKYPRIRDDGHSLGKADSPHELRKLRVLHLVRNQLVAEKAAVHRKRRVERVQARRNLHALDAVHGVAVGHVDAGFLKRRASVGEVVLDDEILRAFRVDERRDERLLLSDERAHVLDAARF